jgi:hypothetical protein
MLEKIKTLRKTTQRFVASLEPNGPCAIKFGKGFMAASTPMLRYKVVACDS